MIAIVDYGVGNLYSLTCSLRHIGMEGVVTRDADTLQSADKIILPGVGAFGDAIGQAARAWAGYPHYETGKRWASRCWACALECSCCLIKGYEYGEHEGLGLIHGHVESMAPYVGDRKVPHMGWNSLDMEQPDDPLLQGIRQGDFVYFVHSFYAADCDTALVATAHYGIPLTAIVRNGNVCGTQFHPEKSGETGLENPIQLRQRSGHMLIFPAIDLRGGKVVRLTQGDYSQMTVYSDDPVETAKGFLYAGATCKCTWWIWTARRTAARKTVP